MADTRVAPFTLTDFASVPEGTVFVMANEYSHTQDELPLGLDWTTAYRKLASASLDAKWYQQLNPGSLYGYAEMIKYRGWGLYLNGLGGSGCDPGDSIITGPPIQHLPKFGGNLDKPELEVLQLIFNLPQTKIPRVMLLPNQDFGFIETITASRTLGRWLDILAQRKLIQLDGTNVYLNNLGVLRAIQEQELNEK